MHSFPGYDIVKNGPNTVAIVFDGNKICQEMPKIPVKNKNGLTPFLLACKNGFEDSADLFIKHFDSSKLISLIVTESPCCLPLHLVCKLKNENSSITDSSDVF